MSSRLRSRFILLLLVIILVLAFAVSSSFANSAKSDDGPQTVVDVELLGMVTFDTGYTYEDTEVGGLSGITYDEAREVYYALSDDRSQINLARYYSVDIDVSDGSLDAGDVTFVAVTTLRDKHGNPYEPGTIDSEAIEMTRPGHLYISSEGDANSDPVVDPFVSRFNPSGKLNRALPVPDKFLPDGDETVGIRDNLAFESLTSAPDFWSLYTAVENALVQDGPKSTLADYSPSRLLEYSLKRHRPGSEYVYMVDPIPFDSNPPGIFADNGLVDLQAIDNFGTFLAMERSFAVGVGNTVRIFETSTDGATDVSDIFALDPDGGPPAVYDPMTKELVVDIVDLGVDPDNLEAMSFGPMLPDGRMLLILASDNNFNPSQITQFIAIAVELGPA